MCFDDALFAHRQKLKDHGDDECEDDEGGKKDKADEDTAEKKDKADKNDKDHEDEDDRAAMWAKQERYTGVRVQ